MNSRERTLCALSLRQPDRVPVDLWISSGFRQKLERRLGITEQAFREAHDIDLAYIEGPRYIGPPLRSFPDGTQEDIWGVRRTAVTVPTGDAEEVYQEVALSPLAFARSVDEVLGYDHWPSPDWFDYSGIERQCEAVRAQGRAVVFMGDRLNRLAQLKPAMYLRGVERILTDMSLYPDLARIIFARICSFYCSYAERIFQAAHGKLDILLTGDDFGTQRAAMVSPTMWEEFLGPGFSQYVRLAKAHGLRVMHHTCGSVRPIIPLMIDRGLDILQSLQPEAADMDPRALKRDFGHRLAFHGGISIQRTLPFGTPEEIREEVRQTIEALAPGGGYVLCTSHNIQADTPIENVIALLAAYREFGHYT